MESSRARCSTCQCVKELQEFPQRDPLPQLPDDVLLEIFSFLPNRDILSTVRSVCRNWSQLTLHASLWARRSLLYQDGGNNSEFAAAMRLVPCLSSLAFPVFNRANIITYNAACYTDCGVTELVLVFPTENLSKSVLIFERLLQRQLELGRLRKLKLKDLPRQGTERIIRLALTGQITELKLRCDWKMVGTMAAPSANICNVAPLKCLSYHSSTADPILEYLLSTFSASLESVRLKCPVTDNMFSLMGKCMRLLNVKTRTDVRLTGLSASTTLTDLTVNVCVPSLFLIPFFRGATQLTKVSFHSCNEILNKSVRDLLLALSSSGESALKELSVGEFMSITVLKRLPTILRGLPLLHTITLEDMLSEVVVDAITASVAPGLRILKFNLHNDEQEMCHGNRKCCFPMLYRLVQRIPNLHVMGLEFYHDCFKENDDDVCGCCASGIHQLGTTSKHCSLYGHDEMEQCSVMHCRSSSQKCPVLLKSPCSCDKHEWLDIKDVRSGFF